MFASLLFWRRSAGAAAREQELRRRPGLQSASARPPGAPAWGRAFGASEASAPLRLRALHSQAVFSECLGYRLPGHVAEAGLAQQQDRAARGSWRWGPWQQLFQIWPEPHRESALQQVRLSRSFELVRGAPAGGARAKRRSHADRDNRWKRKEVTRPKSGQQQLRPLRCNVKAHCQTSHGRTAKREALDEINGNDVAVTGHPWTILDLSCSSKTAEQIPGKTWSSQD